MRRSILISFVLLNLSFLLQAQNTITREDYIELYKELAIKEMKRTGIPASITMAQAILESGNGNSTLAVKAKNHFGIKCHNGWTGKTMKHDDDKKNECFRKYNDVLESFKDHSDFLVEGSRYNFLFEYKSNDYKSWAHGLKKAGYATNKQYAHLLIRIIEDYQLYQLDEGHYKLKYYSKKGEKKPRLETGDEFVIDIFNRRKVYERNRIDYIIADANDNFESLAKELEMMPWQFRKYNELDKNHQFRESEVIYIQPKRNKAAKGFDYHFVQEGESLHDIAQMYGIKLKKLAKRNNLDADSQPKVNEKLYLRKKHKKKADTKEN